MFLVRSVQILLTPLDPMYRAVTGFILAKPALDLYNIPEFLRLLHSREVNSETEQRWVLELVKDGLRDNMDYSIAVKSYVFKLLLSQWNCCLLRSSDNQLLLLDIVLAAVRLARPCVDLVKSHGLLGWLMAVVTGDPVEKGVVKRLAGIVEVVGKTVEEAEQQLGGTVVADLTVVRRRLALLTANEVE